MAEEVRICSLKGLGGTFEMDENQLTGTNSPAPKYTGPLSRALNLFMDLTFGNDSLNYTLVTKTSVGNYNATSGYYDEDSCLYSMQTNQSDLGLSLLWHPVQGKNLKSHPFYIGDIVKMVSRYEVSTKTYASDAMSIFANVFTPGVWLTVVASYFIFWLITKMFLYMENKMISGQRTRDDSLYEVLTHLFQVETVDYKLLGMQFISFFASVLSFVVIAHFTCSIKTDIVVVQEPDMVNSYDDLLTKPNIRLVFPTLSDTLSKFESADPKSKERRAFERSLQFVKGDRDRMILHPAGMDMIQLIDFLRDAAFEKDMRTVACLLETHVRVVLNLVCYLKVLFSRSVDAAKRQTMNFYAWTSQDPHAKENILTLAYSAFYKSPYLEKVQRRIKRIVEMGFMQMLDEFINVPPVEDKMRNREEGDFYRNCKAEDYHQNLPHVECAPFGPIQFRGLSITCGLLLVLSVVAFARERCKKRQSKFRNMLAPGSNAVVLQLDRSVGPRLRAVPFGRMVAAIEGSDQGSRQSRVGATPSTNFPHRKGRQTVKCEVEIARRASTDRSGVFGRRNPSVRSSQNTLPFRYIDEAEEIEVFEQGTQSTSFGQSRVGGASSLNFSNRRGDFDVELWRQIRSRDQPVKWKVTRV